MPTNPLESRRTAASQAPHPALQHARLWAHAQSLSPDQLASGTDLVSYVTTLLGALAANPKVTSKDVVKAAAQAAADGKVSPSKAVEFLSSMPSKPEDLRPWLKNLYVTNMTALVHMKAAAMAGAPAAPQAAPQGQPMPGAMP